MGHFRQEVFRRTHHRALRRRVRPAARAPSSIPARVCPPGQPTSPHADEFIPVPIPPMPMSNDPQALFRWAQQMTMAFQIFRQKGIKIAPQTGEFQYLLSDTAGDGSGLDGIDGGESLTSTDVKTADYTASAGDYVPCDTNSVGSFTVKMPASPSTDDRVGVYHQDEGLPNTLTIDGNGNDITATSTTSITLNDPQSIIFRFVSGLWVAESGPFNV